MSNIQVKELLIGRAREREGIKRVLEGMRKIITTKKECFLNNMLTSICAVLQTLMSRRIDFEWFLT